MNAANPSSTLAAELKRLALELGFDDAGVAGVEPVEQGAAFLRWLERGDQAGMSYLAERTEMRLEPRSVLEGARSVLCVALRYHPLEGEPEPTGDLWPRVARYAHGRDYHNKMGKLLNKLAKRIRSTYPGCDTRVYVDTGPVLERALAARAGLGAVGKNTCLLGRQGSWFLLGEIFLTLELTPDEPLTDLYGRCTRCLEACPTGALPEPYRLDANRCISYWTIEHRGAMPAEQRSAIDDWVFGCDICQQVCPWNIRSSPPADHADLHLPEARGGLDLIALLALDEEEYRRRFNGSAMQRARREGLQRNAATVMGNRREERYRPALERAVLEANDSAVRRHAVWALGELGAGASQQLLERVLIDEQDPELAAEIRSVLAAEPTSEPSLQAEELEDVTRETEKPA